MINDSLKTAAKEFAEWARTTLLGFARPFYDPQDSDRRVLGRVLLVLGVFCAVTSLGAFIDLYFRAARQSHSMFSTSAGYGYQLFFIFNQAALAPLILSGLAFLRNWKAKPVFISLSFCLGMIPVIWMLIYLITPRYLFVAHPLNYGSVFVLLIFTIISVALEFAFARQKRRLKRESQDKDGDT